MLSRAHGEATCLPAAGEVFLSFHVSDGRVNMPPSQIYGTYSSAAPNDPEFLETVPASASGPRNSFSKLRSRGSPGRDCRWRHPTLPSRRRPCLAGDNLPPSGNKLTAQTIDLGVSLHKSRARLRSATAAGKSPRFAYADPRCAYVRASSGFSWRPKSPSRETAFVKLSIAFAKLLIARPNCAIQGDQIPDVDRPGPVAADVKLLGNDQVLIWEAPDYRLPASYR